MQYALIQGRDMVRGIRDHRLGIGIINHGIGVTDFGIGISSQINRIPGSKFSAWITDQNLRELLGSGIRIINQKTGSRAKKNVCHDPATSQSEVTFIIENAWKKLLRLTFQYG